MTAAANSYSYSPFILADLHVKEFPMLTGLKYSSVHSYICRSNVLAK